MATSALQLLLWDALEFISGRRRDSDRPDADGPPRSTQPAHAPRVTKAVPPASPAPPGATTDGPSRIRNDPAQTGTTPSSNSSVEFVRHPRARRYLIRVRLDGSVRVTIPRRGSKREAVAFYEEQRDWVAAHQRRVAGVRDALPQDLLEADQRAFRSRARRELPARLHELANATGLSVRKVSIRNQRHRWGSCSASGLICLNWRLVTMPDWIRDYVLYHELMHLERMDHSPSFWALVEGVCPNYRAARRWLRRHALAPHTAAAHRDTGVVEAESEEHFDATDGC